ncbi:hypothetical protein PsorP6_003208 [Peronosclerospora sorghi]|uniref:Uncharacterized protein n=1 Tax=Peronosclerospora sorghi TaxID=230839 RepID=A0ACC0VJ17_9STRA|nr:hypothetical protein PsorP6_003208 [Peronosclerospora sorghi]
MSARCLKEVRDSAMDYSKMSDRFREEVSRRIRQKKKAKDKIPEKNKCRSRGIKKHARAQRKAAAAKTMNEEYQNTLQIILGFLVTLVTIVASAVFFITRKLQAAGVYVPDHEFKASCCE